MKEPSIKIFISLHKPSLVLKNSILSPIQVGAALSGHPRIPGVLHDDVDDNISELNPRFCELTAQYWAWKNIKADYYGFFHYRRYLSLNRFLPRLDNVWGCVNQTTINTHTADKLHLNAHQIEKMVSQYDIVLPKIRDLKNFPVPGDNPYDQYALSEQLYERDLKLALEILNQKYPDFTPFAEQYLRGSKTYFNNMFIMRKDIFNEYCDWLFDILFECDRQINYDGYSVESLRTPGHLAERLLNIYLLHLKANKKLKIHESQCIFFKNVEPKSSNFVLK